MFLSIMPQRPATEACSRKDTTNVIKNITAHQGKRYFHNHNIKHLQRDQYLAPM